MGDRMKEQAEFLRSLRANRASSFRGEIVPYFRYVFQSGFGLFLSACFFAALIWYVDLIKAVPADWPVRTVGIVTLSTAAVISPLRTYMRSADTVFLLPMETQLLRHYIGPAIGKANASGFVRCLLVFALYAPIYVRSEALAGVAHEQPMELAIVALLVSLIGGLNAYGGWRERQLASASWRLPLRAVRWGLTVLAITAVLLKPLVWAIPFVLLCMAIPSLLWRLSSQHALPWERLIAEEEAVRRRWMAFLGWFVDVPTESVKTYRRKWITWIADRMAWRQSRAWHYLYTLTLLRGETFGAFFRWIIVAAFVLAASDNPTVDAVVYAIALLVGGMQLSELKRVRFVETADALPIPAEERLPAAASVARMLGLTAAVALACVAAATAGGDFSPTVDATVLAVGLLWTGWLLPRRIAKPTEDLD
ncbi:ABC transporter permease [Cohnella yongneupensis]|uniref:ABC transporter permease n=1 Tax=Cohnella yongneupensis TaxID=425006 RepID=A0ABW0QUQ5_9BACL